MERVRLTPRQLSDKARVLRQHVITMLEAAGSGHSAGALGLAEVMTALYFAILRVDPNNPEWSERDILYLSNGHTAPILYAALAEAGFFSVDELVTLRKLGSRLQGHPERTALPGIESTSGPLGSGISQAAGYAYSLQYLDQQPQRQVYCVASDGELNEGNSWEAIMFAAKYKLGQLTVIVDRNNIQIGGSTEDVMPLESLADKWRAFGWHVQEVDGHNIESIITAADMARAIVAQPSVIIAHTIPGKGVDFMEYDYKWHGMAPNHEQAKLALAKLHSLDGKIEPGDRA